MNLKYALIATALLASAPLRLTAQNAPPYGNAITLETARKVAAGAEAEARKSNCAIGVSGMSSAQDGVVAKAGADMVAKP